MTDLNLELGKGRRFAVAPAVLGFGLIVILSDFVYWAGQVEALMAWCEQQHQVKIVGMTVEFEREQELLLFILKWS